MIQTYNMRKSNSSFKSGVKNGIKIMGQNPLEVLRDKFPELAQWLKPLCRFNKDFEDFIIADYKEDFYGKGQPGLRIQFYTKENWYSISAKKLEPQKGKTNDYLGCVAQTRKPRAGEDWTRGRDLADGGYNETTWNEIMADIIAYELVKVVKPIKKDK